MPKRTFFFCGFQDSGPSDKEKEAVPVLGPTWVLRSPWPCKGELAYWSACRHALQRAHSSGGSRVWDGKYPETTLGSCVKKREQGSNPKLGTLNPQTLKPNRDKSSCAWCGAKRGAALVPVRSILVFHSIYPYIYLSIYLAIYLSSDLSICLSIHLSIYPSIHLSIYPSIHLSIYLAIYLPTYVLKHLSTYLAL